MTTNEARTAVTIAIWAAFTAIMIASPAADSTFVTLALLAGTTISTTNIWRTVRSEQDTPFGSTTEKFKRQGTLSSTLVARLVDSLGDDELAELRARLAVRDDGEVVTMEALLDEQERKRARR